MTQSPNTITTVYISDHHRMPIQQILCIAVFLVALMGSGFDAISLMTCINCPYCTASQHAYVYYNSDVYIYPFHVTLIGGCSMVNIAMVWLLVRSNVPTIQLILVNHVAYFCTTHNNLEIQVWADDAYIDCRYAMIPQWDVCLCEYTCCLFTSDQCLTCCYATANMYATVRTSGILNSFIAVVMMITDAYVPVMRHFCCMREAIYPFTLLCMLLTECYSILICKYGYLFSHRLTHMPRGVGREFSGPFSSRIMVYSCTYYQCTISLVNNGTVVDTFYSSLNIGFIGYRYLILSTCKEKSIQR